MMRRGNIGMKHKVVTSLLLGHLFVMIAPSSAGVVILQGEKGIIDHVTGGNTAMFALKGQVDPTGAAHMRKLGRLGGKAHDEKGASFQERQTNIIVQKKKMSMIVPKAPLKFTNVVIPTRSSSVSNTSSKRSQEDSNPVAAKEIMSLIHKDYKGEAARRRSPINNQEPTN